MRHYEIILIVRPDQSGQIQAMLERYKTIITNHGGLVHRVEDWGRRQMAYMIAKFAKAHYVCLNIEYDPIHLQELEQNFKFNDAILRHAIFSQEKAETEHSPIMKELLAQANSEATEVVADSEKVEN